MPRTDIFFDAQNFSISCREFVGYHVNVKACARYLARKTGHELGQVFWYDSPSPTLEVQSRQNRFWDEIRKVGVDVRLGRTEPIYGGGHVEKETDIMIAVDMVIRAFKKKYDQAILVSGDTDIAYAVEVVKELGVSVAWAHLPTQEHVDRYLQIIPEEKRILLEEKHLRTMTLRPARGL